MKCLKEFASIRNSQRFKYSFFTNLLTNEKTIFNVKKCNMSYICNRNGRFRFSEIKNKDENSKLKENPTTKIDNSNNQNLNDQPNLNENLKSEKSENENKKEKIDDNKDNKDQNENSENNEKENTKDSKDSTFWKQFRILRRNLYRSILYIGLALTIANSYLYYRRDKSKPDNSYLYNKDVYKFIRYFAELKIMVQKVSYRFLYLSH